MGPFTFVEGDCPSDPIEKLICPKCAGIITHALEFLSLPFEEACPKKAFGKPISLGRIFVNA